jgi:spermidine synthase
MNSIDYLKTCNKKFDVIYIDTGDMTPIEETSTNQLLEAHLIDSYELLNKNGIILIDDVRNPLSKRDGEQSNYGKAKYSIPFFKENGYEILFDEYQVVLRKL